MADMIDIGVKNADINENEVIKPIRSIVSSKDYRKLKLEYLRESSRPVFKNKKNQKMHEKLLSRYEAALEKGIRKDKLTKSRSSIKNIKEDIKRSRKANRRTKGRTKKM